MHLFRRAGVVGIALAGAFLVVAPGGGAEPDKPKVGPDLDQWERVVAGGVKYLKSSQKQDGSWSSDKSPGVTGIALTGLLRTGKVTPADPVADKALKYIESLVNTEAGHIAGKAPRVQ